MLANLPLPFSLPPHTPPLLPSQVLQWTSRWSWRTRGRSSSGAAPSRGCRSPTSSSRSPRSPSWSPRPTIAPRWATGATLDAMATDGNASDDSLGPRVCGSQLHALVEDTDLQRCRCCSAQYSESSTNRYKCTFPCVLTNVLTVATAE